MTTYRRERQRQGPVPLSTKVYQAIGALPDTLKNFAFGTFLLFYYNQVMNLPASWASAAIMVALVFDAVTDPLMGSISDRLKTRLGRRHPLMYIAVLPLALSLYFVFAPPDGLGHVGLFAWLLFWAVAVRTAMTFYLVPWNALYAEFSDDYVERTSIITYRYLFGWIGGLTFTFCTWTFIFPTTPEFSPGHLNASRYALFGAVVASLVGLAAFLTTNLTRREIPYLLQPADAPAPFRFRQVFDDFALAMRNRDYRLLVVASLTAYAVVGADGSLNIYMSTYFWGFLPEDLRWFTIAAIGSLIAFAGVTPLQRRIDKRRLLIGCVLFLLVDSATIVTLRFLDVLPANGDPLLLVILVSNQVAVATVLTSGGIMFTSMVADLLDAQEHQTGRRQEGMFSAALSFASKATSGLGVLIGGLLLQHAISFPAGARPAAVAPAVVFDLGLWAGIVLPFFYLVPLSLIARYRLTREVHAGIQRDLVQRRAADGSGRSEGAAA